MSRLPTSVQTVLGKELAPPARFRPEHDEAFAERQWIGAARPGSSAHQDVEILTEQVRRSLDQARPVSWPPPLVEGNLQADRTPKLLGPPVTALGLPSAAPAPLRLSKATAAEPRVVFLDEQTTAQLRRNGAGGRKGLGDSPGRQPDASAAAASLREPV
jgi:hypothetical protein